MGEMPQIRQGNESGDMEVLLIRVSPRTFSLTIKRILRSFPTSFPFLLKGVGIGFVGPTQYTLEVLEHRAADHHLALVHTKQMRAR